LDVFYCLYHNDAVQCEEHLKMIVQSIFQQQKQQSHFILECCIILRLSARK
jgi:hypothetical protein